MALDELDELIKVGLLLQTDALRRPWGSWRACS